jgi:predicted thioesterase
MIDTIKVILDLSDDIQELLAKEQIDLYKEIQEELPSVRLEVMSDPEAPVGSRDLTTVILATATLVSALTPIVVRILNQFKPDSTELVVDETETRHSDGSTTNHRTRISSKREYNRQANYVQPSGDKLKLDSSADTKNTSN